MKIVDFISKKNKSIIDIESLTKLFTTNPIKQECYKLMIKEVANSKEPYFLSKFRKKYAKENRYKGKTNNQWRFHCPMVSEVWKSLLEIGMFQRKRRGGEVKISKKFSMILDDMSSYWNKYVEAKKK